MAVAMTVSGCGGGDGEAGSGGKKGDPSASPTAAYFVRADTDAINAAAVKAQKTGAQAQAAKAQTACNKAGNRGYEQWRTCWHNLLDPFKASLTGLATELGTLAKRDFPEDCVTSLGAAEAAFTGFATEVEELLAGIDSKRRAAQVRALRIYGDDPGRDLQELRRAVPGGHAGLLLTEGPRQHPGEPATRPSPSPSN